MYYVCKNSKRMQRELKVGDKVKIISDRKVRSLRSQKYSLMFGFDNGMFQYCGEEFVITEKEKSNRYYDDGTIAIKFYLAGIEEYMFSVEMFESSPALLKNE